MASMVSSSSRSWLTTIAPPASSPAARSPPRGPRGRDCWSARRAGGSRARRTRGRQGRPGCVGRPDSVDERCLHGRAPARPGRGRRRCAPPASSRRGPIPRRWPRRASARSQQGQRLATPNRSATVSSAPRPERLGASTPKGSARRTRPPRAAQLAGDQLEKRRLADAVAADEPRAFGLEAQVEVGEERSAVRRGPRESERVMEGGMEIPKGKAGERCGGGAVHDGRVL